MNGVLSMLCAVFSVLLIVALQLSPQWRRIPATKAAFQIMTFVFFMLLCDGVAVLFLTDRPFWFNVLETASVVASYLAEWCFGLFVVTLTDLSSAAKRVVLSFVGVSCLAWIALFIVNCIDPFLYDFGELRYLSGVGAVCAQVNGFVFAGLAILLLLWKGDKMAMRGRVFMSVTLLLPMTSMIWDSLIPGLSSRYELVFLTMAANYIHVIFALTETTQRQVNQLERQKVFSTMERIKPHYIYNVLASIYYLCDRDVDLAKQAIEIFSDYLRDALSLMEEQTLVPFSRELRIVQNYLDLEKMRFGDKVRVRYRIYADEFLIPPFSVQPLVENSVKHGLANSEDGGEIVITSFEDDDGYIVMIQDSYEGFDPDRQESGSGGSGTKYIREILGMTVNGILRIDSKPGYGTVSSIVIPKKK